MEKRKAIIACYEFYEEKDWHCPEYFVSQTNTLWHYKKQIDTDDGRPVFCWVCMEGKMPSEGGYDEMICGEGYVQKGLAIHVQCVDLSEAIAYHRRDLHWRNDE